MCRMALPRNDTPEAGLRAWLASQLKLEDVPDSIWDRLLEKGYVGEAEDPDYPKGREYLLEEARSLLRIHRDGSGAPKARKRQRTTKRQRATAASRSEAEAKIAAKVSEARARTLEGGALNDASGRADAPLAASIRNNKITITAQPWVSPEAIKRAYADLRDDWFWSETPSEQRVKLCGFVADRCEGYYDKKIVGLNPSVSWREMMSQWNERYPEGHDWHYGDVRNFRRDFAETFESLTRYSTF